MLAVDVAYCFYCCRKWMVLVTYDVGIKKIVLLCFLNINFMDITFK